MTEIRITDEDNARADEILESPGLLLEIKELLDVEIAREVRNKLLVFILELSAKFEDVSKRLIILLLGESGGGKTLLANTTTRCFGNKVKKRARFSEHALDYSDLKNYLILYIQELPDLEKAEKFGLGTLRFMSADDDGYTAEVTYRDKDTGLLKTQELRIPPMTIVSTTTRTRIEEQFTRRAWPINTDETPETTEAVLDHKASKYGRKVKEMLGLQKKSRALNVLAAIVQRLPTDIDIIVTTPNTIKMFFDKRVLGSRGHYEKLLALTELVAYMHYRQRPHIIRKLPSGIERKAILTLPQDLFLAADIASDSLVTLRTMLEKRARNVVPVLNELRGNRVLIKGEDFIDGFTVREFQRAISKSQKYTAWAARDLLFELENHGMVEVVLQGRGNKGNVFKVSFSEEELRESLDLFESVNFTDKLRQSAAEEAKNAIATLCVNAPEGYTYLLESGFLFPRASLGPPHTQTEVPEPPDSVGKEPKIYVKLPDTGNFQLVVKKEDISKPWAVFSVPEFYRFPILFRLLEGDSR